MEQEQNKCYRLSGINKLYAVCANQAELIEDGAILICGEKIEWVGKRTDAPPIRESEQEIDLGGVLVTPGWIDAHTHLIWAGSRQNEFRRRLEGATYLEIAKAGGGIMSTVREVRKANLEDLVEGGRQRMRRLLSFGVTTIEVKSGYGLDLESECKMLRAARILNSEGTQELVSTFLGAHTVPTEYKERRERYIDLVCEEMIPKVAEEKLAEYCDVFVEEGAFSCAEARRILECGQQHGLRSRIHAEQMSAMGGAKLAAELGAVSADHLEEIDDEGIAALAAADVVACLIPGSTFCLRQKKYAPARKLLDAGVTVALATDVNPGTTCSENLPMIGTIAAIQMRMQPLEILRAVTSGAARALNRHTEIGSLAPGYRADIAVFNAPDLDYLFYHYAISHLQRAYIRGNCLWPTSPII
jgi:imidazolonepropionase